MRVCCLLLLFGLLAGCAKQPDLPDVVVTASSPGEFTQFRADLGLRFPAEQLKDFDTATRELELDAMNRNFATVDARAIEMLRIVNGQTVQTIVRLGWVARRARFLREIADLNGMLERDLALQSKSAATGTPESITRRIGSEKEVLAQLQHNLAETEARLKELGAPAGN